MKATSIPNHESGFFESKKDSSGKTFDLTEKTVSIGDTTEKLNYVECRLKNGDKSFFYNEKWTKTQVVIHFTAGYLRGDISTLTKPDNHVSVPYIMARNGKILEMWDADLWSYHLGNGTVGGNTERSKRTIGIEISNIGYLKKKGDNLVTVYNDTDIYCNLNETQYYSKTDQAFRGQDYYASFTNEQYESLITLLRYLTTKYDIPRAFLTLDKRYVTGETDDIVNFKGIVTHINYRPSGKWDIGPAFDWQRLIEGVQK